MSHPTPSTAGGATPIFTRTNLAVVGIATSLLLVVGSVGPWATALGFSKNGVDADGVITLILGLLAAAGLVAVLTVGGTLRVVAAWVAVAAGALATATSVYDVFDVTGTDAGVVEIQVGWGLWLATFSAVVLTVVALVVAISSAGAGGRSRADRPAP